jgi:hypothetical protein
VPPHLVAAFVLALLLPVVTAAQSRPPGVTPGHGPHPHPALEEHATGGEAPLLVAGVSLLGLVGYDIATAPASARWHNELHPERPAKSPRTALLLSLAATTVPVGLGAIAYDRGSSGGSALSIAGAGLTIVGLSAGPSAGHWYADRRSRALRNTGLRAALLLGAAYLESCCT